MRNNSTHARGFIQARDWPLGSFVRSFIHSFIHFISFHLIHDIVLTSSEHVPVSQLQPKRIIQVHRLNIKKDMTDLFRDPIIMRQDVEMIVIDASGVEEVGRADGLLRDIFSLFWKENYDSLFVGENEHVPFERHDCQREEWVAVGRILVKGYLTCQNLPVLSSQTFLACLF